MMLITGEENYEEVSRVENSKTHGNNIGVVRSRQARTHFSLSFIHILRAIPLLLLQCYSLCL